MMKYIVLCADDYGLNTSVSQGIIELLKAKRLSAVSCLTTSPEWAEQAPWLKSYHEQADMGLHFNLTEGQPLSSLYRERYGTSFLSLSHLIIKSFLHQLDITILEAECQAQLERFVTELGFLPDFIDGHQHVHQLPQVRDAVLKVYENYLRKNKAYLRSVTKAIKSRDWGGRFKQSIIYLCGSQVFQQQLIAKAIPHNTVFAGIYAFPQAEQYRQIFPYFLKNIENKGLIMCHPGLLNPSTNSHDPIAQARFQEFSYLSSEQFELDCQGSGVQIARLMTIPL